MTMNMNMTASFQINDWVNQKPDHPIYLKDKVFINCSGIVENIWYDDQEGWMMIILIDCGKNFSHSLCCNAEDFTIKG